SRSNTSGIADSTFHDAVGASQPMGQQSGPDPDDCFAVAYAAAPGSLKTQVALCIETHRAVVDVGRADPEQAVIDDCQLGMDDDDPAQCCDGAVGLEPEVLVRTLQCLDEFDPGAIHGRL